MINVEIKARCSGHEGIRQYLKNNVAEFRGSDRQLDTYFKVPNGRLKLREGTIEKNLIWYDRPDLAGPKTSRCILHSTAEGGSLKQALEAATGIMAVVDKKREIYFLGNIKVHLDEVEGLGSFIEIEAQSREGDMSEDYLLSQCKGLMKDLGIEESALVEVSYSDLLMAGDRDANEQ